MPLPPPPGRTNRIEVDLKLLEDANLQKLKEFGAQFDKSVKSLGVMLGEYAEQISGAATIASGPGKVGQDASVAKPSTIETRVGGTQQVYGGFFQSPGASGGGFANQPPLPPAPPGEASVAGTSSGEPSGGAGRQFEQGYVTAIKRVGEKVPVGLRQLTGFAAEGQLVGQKRLWLTADGRRTTNVTEAAPLVDENGNQVLDKNGNPVPTPVIDSETGQQLAFGQEAMRRINQNLFTMQALRANASLLGSHLSNTRAGILGMTQTGQNLGYARTGSFFGIGGLGFIPRIFGGLGGPAFTESLRENFDAMKESWFGLNPNFSTAQAKQLNQLVQQYGYSGDTSDRIRDYLKNLEIHQNIAPDQAMQILDPFIRFGGTENMQQLGDILAAIPDAAKAAKMNLQQFTQELVSTATSVAQVTGMTPGNAANALMAFSTVTGLAPQRAQSLMTNPKNYILASGMTGQSIWQLTQGHNQMAGLQAFGIMQFRNAVGGATPEQLFNALKQPKDSAAYKAADAALSRAQLLYMTNPDIFGGFSPRELMNQAERAGGYSGIGRRESAIQELTAASTKGPINFDSYIRRFDSGNNKKISETEAKLSDFMQGYDKKHTGTTIQDQIARRDAEKRELLLLFANQSRTAGEKAARQMTIGFTNETRRYFQLLNSTYGSGNKSKSNMWHMADAFAKKAMYGVGDLAGAVPGVGGVLKTGIDDLTNLIG